MAKPESVVPEINLLPTDDIEGRPGGRIVRWALNWGKKIVIITELIVVLAFLSRFKLDSDVANLSDEIDRKKTIIQASADFETKFKKVSERVNDIKTLESFVSPAVIIDKALVLIPDSVIVSQISVTGRQISFTGNGDDASLNQMVIAYKDSSDFSDIDINRVSKDAKDVSNLSITFSFSANYARY